MQFPETIKHVMYEQLGEDSYKYHEEKYIRYAVYEGVVQNLRDDINYLTKEDKYVKGLEEAVRILQEQLKVEKDKNHLLNMLVEAMNGK